MRKLSKFLLLLLFCDISWGEEASHDIFSDPKFKARVENCDTEVLQEIKRILVGYKSSGILTDKDRSDLIKLLGFQDPKNQLSGQAANTGKKRAVLVGGTGEEFAKENVFTKDFAKFRGNLEKRGWNVEVNFDGPKFRLPNANLATNENIKASLANVETSSHAGDEVLLFFHGHGQKKSGGQKTHNFITEDQNGFDMDALQDTAARLTAKGVKVAVVDLSCYSGNTQALDLPSACVLTLGSKDYVTVCSDADNASAFTSAFTDFNAADRGLNLQDQFLKARKFDTKSPNFPQLSSLVTPARPAFDRFLKSTDPDGVSRKGRIGEGGGGGPLIFDSSFFLQNRCPPEMLPEWIGLHQSALKALFADTFKVDVEKTNQELAKLFESYFKTKEGLEEARKKFSEVVLSKGWGIQDPTPKSFLVWKSKVPALKEKLDHTSLQQLEVIIQMTKPEVNLDEIMWLSSEEKKYIEEFKPYHAQIKDTFEKFKTENAEVWNNYEKLAKEYADLGKSILAKEREFYDAFQAATAKRDNPCASFTL